MRRGRALTGLWRQRKHVDAAARQRAWYARSRKVQKEAQVEKPHQHGQDEGLGHILDRQYKETDAALRDALIGKQEQEAMTAQARQRAQEARQGAQYAASNETIIGACTVTDKRDRFGRIMVDAPPSRPRYDIHSDPYGCSLRVRLIDACNGNVDASSDISPIRALLAQGFRGRIARPLRRRKSLLEH
jgi:hypothetical protein